MSTQIPTPSLSGEELEVLAGLVQTYNDGLLAEKAGKEKKDAASKDVMNLLRDKDGLREIEVIGHSVKVITWTRESISVRDARNLLSQNDCGRLIKESSGVRPDIRPLRSTS